MSLKRNFYGVPVADRGDDLRCHWVRLSMIDDHPQRCPEGSSNPFKPTISQTQLHRMTFLFRGSVLYLFCGFRRFEW